MTLIARLQALTVPDREVDAEIAVLFSGDQCAFVVRLDEGSMFSHKPGWFATGDNKSHKSPEYTASLDAAVALIDKVLPGWTWSRDKDGYMYLYQPYSDECISYGGATPAIALATCIVAATLTAKEAKDAE